MARAKNKNLDYVNYLGFVNIENEIHKYDVLVSLSAHEGFSRILLESSFVGLYVVSFENSGTKFISELKPNKTTWEYSFKWKPPKYNTIVNKISELTQDAKHLGTAFVYTEYKTLEGIAVFSVILNANGYAPFRLGKNDAGEWIQKFKDDSEINKPKYAFWGGNEEESDIIRKIYNNDFEELPKTLVEQFKTMKVNNLRGVDS